MPMTPAQESRMWLPHKHRQPETVLLYDLLKRVSRSFYLSLRVLTRAARKPVSLAYLFCRAADTIADTALFPPAQRWHVLQHLRRLFLQPPRLSSVTPQALTLGVPWASGQEHDAEYQLLLHVSQCFTIFSSLAAHEQRLVSNLVCTLTHGMAMDLTYFRAKTPHTLQVLPNRGTLDLYTYYVAGVVGEFWTKIHAQALQGDSLAEWYHLCDLATHFGKGLQMTNILKDLGKDCGQGRCYLPDEALTQVGLTAADLTRPTALVALHPLLCQYIWETLAHLDHAYHYILRIPYWALRLRLSCMWPLLFAVQTLEVISSADDLLHATARVKISRQAIYRTLYLSTVCLLLPGMFGRYYATLRQRLTRTLHTTAPTCTPTSMAPSHR